MLTSVLLKNRYKSHKKQENIFFPLTLFSIFLKERRGKVCINKKKLAVIN